MEQHFEVDRTYRNEGQGFTSDVTALLERSRDFDRYKHDHVTRANALRFDEQADLVVLNGFAAGGNVMTLTDQAWRHIGGKLGPVVFGKGSAKVLPMDYLLACPPDLRAVVLNRHLQAADSEWLVRGYTDRCRAILAGNYPRIENTTLLKAVSDIADAQANIRDSGAVVRSSVSPDELHLKVVVKTVNPNGRSDGGYGIGVYVGNSEIGGGKVKVSPMIQRHSCLNSLIIDVRSADLGVSLVHRGSAVAMMTLVHAAMVNCLEASGEVLDKLLASQARALPNLADVVTGIAKTHQWNDDVKNAVLVGTENAHNLFGLINGITYAAHTTQQESPAAMAEMETVAGGLLYAPFAEVVSYARLASAN